MLESKSRHESLNLAHESDSSPSPGLEYYNTALKGLKLTDNWSDFKVRCLLLLAFTADAQVFKF